MTRSNIQTIFNRYEKSKIGEQTKGREILQQTALLGLERTGFFEKAAFYGGTALRILYGLDRFSEDLDFTLLKPNPMFDFTPFLEGLRRELFAFGFNMEVSQKIKTSETSVLSAFMKANSLELHLSINQETKAAQIHPSEKIQIKIEVDTNPPIPLPRFENQLVLNPMTFYALTLHKSDLFAGKMAAILLRAWKGRVKGRDWYDLVWYIQNNVPLSLSYLESCLKQAEKLEAKEVLTHHRLLELLTVKIRSIEWESAKADVRSFIADPQRLDIWSAAFFEALIRHMKIE
jgi:predicted nucleotidyltransferase component of viral defense system